MKCELLFLLLGLSLVKMTLAQKPSDFFTIEGDGITTVQIVESNLKSYSTIHLDSIRIYGHDMQPKSLMKNVEGILLKEILSRIPLNNENPKVLSACYFECLATDGYRVIFSWNEIFNSETGNHVMIITEKNGTDFTNQDDRIALISPTDRATGRRYVKWLSKIIVHRVK